MSELVHLLRHARSVEKIEILDLAKKNSSIILPQELVVRSPSKLEQCERA